MRAEAVMPRLTDYTRRADALAHFSKEALWALFDGDRNRLNIGHECVDRHDPARLAVSIVQDTGGYEHITFGELARWSSRVANHLQAEGLAAGERVAIMLEPGLPFYALLIGAMKAGVVAVPLFTLFGPDGLALRLDDCAPTVLYTSEALAPVARAATAGRDAAARIVVADAAWLDRISAAGDSFAPATRADDMAMFQYTSGTTRELPEAVKHRHRAVVTVAVAALYATGVRPGDRFMCPSSPAWGHGLWHGTLAPLGLGVSIASYAGRFRPERLLVALSDLGITNLSAAATHYRMMRNSGAAGRWRYALQKLSFTGEPIDDETALWVRETFGRLPASMYGSTEIGVIIADYPGAADHEVRLGALGKPVPGQEVAVLDAAGKPCRPGEVGEIMVRRGDGWFPTKDLGLVDADGYFFHRGRADDVIISAGWTMSAVEIENTLLAHPAVAEAAAIGVPDPERGQVVKAFIVPRGQAAGDGLAAELQRFTKERLSQHEYPRQIAFVAELPKTTTGKIARAKLREAERQARGEST
jgi:acetyl-CoA synthetase